MFNFFRRKAKEEKALHSINSGAWSRVLEPFGGAWQRNIEIRLDSVLAYPAIFSCISLISSDVAKMPVSVKRRQSNGVWVKGNDPVLSPLLIKPNFYQTAMQFFELWMISKLAHGNAYILKLRDSANRVQQLRVLDPRRVIPYISDDGEIFYSILTDELNGLSGGLYVPARELIHDRFNTLFHPLCGLSPIYASGLAAIGGEAMLRNSAHTFQNGGKPGGIIVVPGSVDREKAQEIKDNWNSGYSGENAGKTALLADGASFVAVSQNATDSQLVEQLNLSNQLVASTFRVPLYKIDTGQTPSYNNIEALEQAYYSQCLQVHMTAIETLIADTFNLNEQTCVEFDHGRLLRMDTAARYKSYGDGIGAGFLAPNEARIKENMQPVEGGDTPYLQQQNYSLEALAKRDAQDDPFTTSSSQTPTPTPTSDNNGSPDAPDPNEPASEDDTREFASIAAVKIGLEGAEDMLSTRDVSLAESMGELFSIQLDKLQRDLKVSFQSVFLEKESKIDDLNSELSVLYQYISEVRESFNLQNELNSKMNTRISEIENDVIDESDIAARVYAQIEPPELPDFGKLIHAEIAKIKIPEPQPLPDFKALIDEAIAKTLSERELQISEPDIEGMIAKAVAAIQVPVPEPIAVPDFKGMVKEAVDQISIPEPEPLPDIEGMVTKAIAEIPLPKPEPLPDIGFMVSEAVKQISVPEPEPLPDIGKMVKEAVSAIKFPEPLKPEPLPDIASMISDAVKAIVIPQPEPLPDIEGMVTKAVSAITLPEPEPLPDIAKMVSDAVKAIVIPEPEPLPDIESMVKAAVSDIEIPEPIKPELPDFYALIQRAVSEYPMPEPEPLPDLELMVTKAVVDVISSIDLPQPEPLPDIVAIVNKAVSGITIPQPEPLPDIEGMIKQAVAEIPIPEPEKLPDVGKLVSDVIADAFAGIVLPEPEPLPDIDKMVLDAVEAVLLPVMVKRDDVKSMVEDAIEEIKLPEPEPLPDFAKMIQDAVSRIELPKPADPEPLPDIESMVKAAVDNIEIVIPEPLPLPDFKPMVDDAVNKAVSELAMPEPGKKGDDGRDALQIEVMPEIDTSKSYPRGTYALHNGGLWRAYQKTAGLSGWECVVNGLNDISVNLENDRIFTFNLSQSNGEVQTKTFSLPVMIYRDVYQPGRTYQEGDCVTFGGSIWHCYKATSDRPNEAGSSGWKLAVKRGRDGR